MKKIFMLMSLCTSLMTYGQSNFEGLTLPPSNFWKGVAAVPTISGFQSGPAYFVNVYDTSFGGFWSGWGYSALNDTISTSYATNELGCIAGKGYNQSNIYGVAYVGSNEAANRIKLAPGSMPLGFYITNTTIAYRSMQNGDAFAKKFGGATGNDPDFFKLHLTGWYNGVPKPDTVEIYLADFRDSNNANDYILKEWTWVNTSLLGMCDSLTYTMSSSDTAFGFINTPTYFCIDNLSFFGNAVDQLEENNQLLAYPNPCSNQLHLANNEEQEMSIRIYNIHGQQFAPFILEKNQTFSLNTSNWSPGVYFIQSSTSKQQSTFKLIKQ
jgi:hypothetical protein